MKSITVSTTVKNEVCDESREYNFKEGTLNAYVHLHPKKQGAIWASCHKDGTWSLGIHNLYVHDLSSDEMVRLSEAINNETKEKIDGSSNDGA